MMVIVYGAGGNKKPLPDVLLLLLIPLRFVRHAFRRNACDVLAFHSGWPTALYLVSYIACLSLSPCSASGTAEFNTRISRVIVLVAVKRDHLEDAWERCKSSARI